MTRLLVITLVGCSLFSCKNSHNQVSKIAAINGTWIVDSFENNSESFNKVEDLLLTSVDFSGMIFEFDDKNLKVFSESMELEEQETIELLENNTIIVGKNKATFQMDEDHLVLRFDGGSYFLSKYNH